MPIPRKMELNCNPALQEVAEYMQSRLPAAALVSIAEELARIAPLLWGHFKPEPIRALTLAYSDGPLPSDCEPRAQSIATE